MNVLHIRKFEVFVFGYVTFIDFRGLLYSFTFSLYIQRNDYLIFCSFFDFLKFEILVDIEISFFLRTTSF